MRSSWFSVMVAASVGLGSASALANGRYPNADLLVVDPSDATHLVLRATFGTLVSSDQGSTWFWICEQAVGYTGGDPALTVLSGGSLLHAFVGSVTVSAAQGCSFEPVPFNAEGRTIIDVTLNPADPTHAWVLASGLNGRREASLLDVSATGASSRVVSDDFVPSTVEVARSRPERMYVLGFDGSFQSTLLVSDDAGESWLPRPISPYSALPMYLSAIDPTDPDRLYVRVHDGTSDHLLVSRDAGQSFVDALTLPSEMLGFALSPDGSRVAVGGPGAGLWVASSADLAFAAGASVQSLRCLNWSERGLYACAQESLDHWTLALSTDAGQTFTPLWHVEDLEPLDCATSTSAGAACPSAWLDVSAQVGADLVPDGIPNSASAGGSGGSGGGSAGSAATASKHASSCDVAAPRSAGSAPLGASLALGLLGALALRQRRSSAGA